MANHPIASEGPVTVTFSAGQWHLLLRELVYCVSTAEAVRDDLVRNADPRRDAYALAVTERLVHAVQAGDRASEMLADAQANPVPS